MSFQNELQNFSKSNSKEIETESAHFKTEKKGKWSEKEDEQLTKLVKIYNYKNWKSISQHIPGRTAIQCLHRWTKILQPGLVKGPWTAQEDAKLFDWVKRQGPTKWTLCSEIIPGRSGKQCREHWNNSLNPEVKKGYWTSEEDFLIMFFYKKYNGSWKKIIPIFNKRTENSIKNRFFSQLRKIATMKTQSKEKKFSARIKLETLLNYLNFATLKAKEKFLKEKSMSEKELEKYIENINKKIIKNLPKNKINSLESKDFKEYNINNLNINENNNNFQDNLDNNNNNNDNNNNNNNNNNFNYNNYNNNNLLKFNKLKKLKIMNFNSLKQSIKKRNLDNFYKINFKTSYNKTFHKRSFDSNLTSEKISNNNNNNENSFLEEITDILNDVSNNSESKSNNNNNKKNNKKSNENSLDNENSIKKEDDDDNNKIADPRINFEFINNINRSRPQTSYGGLKQRKKNLQSALQTSKYKTKNNFYLND